MSADFGLTIAPWHVEEFMASHNYSPVICKEDMIVVSNIAPAAAKQTQAMF
jgi:hypothetical protein